MLELEPTPDPPSTSARSSLLRRLFRPEDISFYLMIVLVWAGSIYTTFDPRGSRWYWQWIIPLLGLICIATEWFNVEANLKARALMILRQILHWGAVLLLTLLIFYASERGAYINALDDRQASFVLMLIITLSMFLAGIYLDWRLCLVAVFLIVTAVINVALSNAAPLLIWVGLGVIVLYFVWEWWYTRRPASSKIDPSPTH
jgi:hypothetical protein